MNALELTKQVLGLAPVRPLDMDLKLLNGTIDALGRTLPMQFTGAAVQWLGAEGAELTRNGYSNHSTAYSIINYILTTGAALPWGVYQLQADDTGKRLAKHPLYNVMYRPNPRQTWPELLTEAKGYLLTTGNAYLYGVRPAFGGSSGKIGEIWVLPSALVEVLGGEWMKEVTGYRIRNENGTYTTYEPTDILHLKFWNPDNSRYGLSPIAAGIDSVTAAKAGLTSRVRQYQNEGPPGLLHGKGEGAAWTPEQADRVQSWFSSFFRGGRRSGKVPVISQEVGFLNMGLSPVDLDVLAAIPHDKDAVADLFRFPGHLLNGSRGTTFANYGEAARGLYNRCVVPLETQLRDGLNRWIGPDYADAVYLDFDLSGVSELQANKQEMATWLSTAWWIAVEDKQKMMGVETNWDGPKFMVPAGLVGSDSLGALDTEVPA
jgi:HK97 family phage portal protein